MRDKENIQPARYSDRVETTKISSENGKLNLFSRFQQDKLSNCEKQSVKKAVCVVWVDCDGFQSLCSFIAKG